MGAMSRTNIAKEMLSVAGAEIAAALEGHLRDGARRELGPSGPGAMVHAGTRPADPSI